MESDFYIFLLVAGIKKSDRWLNVGIYGLISMLTFNYATFIYKELLYSAEGYVCFSITMVFLIIWRSTILIMRSEAHPPESYPLN